MKVGHTLEFLFGIIAFFVKNKGKHLAISLLHINDMIYSSWDIEHDRLKLVILGHYLFFYQKRAQRIKILKKMKKIAGDIIIIHVYQKSQLYDLRFLDTEWDRHNFLSFWVISCAFIALMIPKTKILKKWKKFLEILPLYTLSFGLFFAFLPL